MLCSHNSEARVVHTISRSEFDRDTFGYVTGWLIQQIAYQSKFWVSPRYETSQTQRSVLLFKLCCKVQFGTIHTNVPTFSVAKRFWFLSGGISLCNHHPLVSYVRMQYRAMHVSARFTDVFFVLAEILRSSAFVFPVVLWAFVSQFVGNPTQTSEGRELIQITTTLCTSLHVTQSNVYCQNRIRLLVKR